MLSVLVVSPDPGVPGGVSVFVECLKRHFQGGKADSFYVGSAGKGVEPLFSVLSRLIKAPFHLCRLVKQRPYDLVHINPSFDAKSLIRDGILLLALRRAGYDRIFMYFHGWDRALQKRVLGRGWGQGLLRRSAAWLLNKAALISVLGADFRDGLVAMGVDPARIAVTHTMFEGAELKAAQRDTPQNGRNSPQRPYILFMSRFDPEKGARELLQGFAALAADYPDYDLVLAGDGPYMGFLRTETKILGLDARVTFPGYVTGADKWRLLRDCSLFALPTYYGREGMPVAVLEAMGAGKPVLAGSAGSLRALLSDPENGVVLDTVTAESVASGLRRLLSDPEAAKEIGRRNAELAWNKYEAHAVTAEIESFYRKVAQC
jgi:glycosyltransferase involved in cell wall biosynthesis